MYGRNRGQFGGNMNQGAFISRPGNFGATAMATTNGSGPAVPPPRPAPNGGMMTPGGQVCYDPMQYAQTCMQELLATSGNAGLPGCDVTGFACGYQILSFAVRNIAPGADWEANIEALRAGAFKTRFVYMFGIGSTLATSATNTRFEVATVQVSSEPQLISNGEGAGFTGANGYRVLSDIFNRTDHPLAVSWRTFGDTNGNTLRITGRSLADINQDIYIGLFGDAAQCGIGSIA